MTFLIRKSTFLFAEKGTSLFAEISTFLFAENGTLLFAVYKRIVSVMELHEKPEPGNVRPDLSTLVRQI